MKRVLIFIFISSLISLSGCNYFKKHRLFSKDVDTLLDQSAETTDTAEVISDEGLTEENASVTDQGAGQSSGVTQGYGSENYYMIVGCFLNQDLANKYAEKIRQMGYETQIIPSSNGFYKVSAKSFSSFQQGIGELEDFRNNITAKAWLHVRQ